LPAKILKEMGNPTPEEMKAVSIANRKVSPKRRKHPEPVKKDFNYDIVSNRVLREIGDQEAVAAFLQHDDPRYRELARSLMDKEFDSKSFRALYQRVGLTMVDIIDAFRKYCLDRAVIAIAKGTPTVAQGVIEDASPHMQLCPRCDAHGWVPDVNEEGEDIKRVCPQCDGEKKIRVMGDKDSKKLVFESTGLVKQAPAVAIQQNFNVPPMEQQIKELGDAGRQEESQSQKGSSEDQASWED